MTSERGNALSPVPRNFTKAPERGIGARKPELPLLCFFSFLFGSLTSTVKEDGQKKFALSKIFYFFSKFIWWVEPEYRYNRYISCHTNFNMNYEMWKANLTIIAQKSNKVAKMTTPTKLSDKISFTFFTALLLLWCRTRSSWRCLIQKKRVNFSGEDNRTW